MDTTVGDLISARRRTAGITQKQLAERAGLSVGAVRDIEQGRTARPRPEALRKLFAVVGLSDQDLARQLAERESRTPATPWRFQVLGPFRVTFNGVPVDVGPPRQRAVLGLLALSPNAFVHRDAIADALWADQPAEAARRLVPGAVSRLRRALAEAGRRVKRELVVSDGSRYQLAVHVDEHDLLRFRRLVATAALEPALRLFTGEPLADLADLHNLPELTAIRIERTAAVLAYADVADAADALPHLRVAAVAEPLHTDVQAKFLLALAGTGQTAAAVRHFEAVRQHLADELGVEPDEALLAARQQILGRPTVAAPVPAQLPADTADFTGRRPDIERLRAALGAQGPAPVVCAITGTGGIGKTALALHVAHQVRSTFPDGQLYVDLRGASAVPALPGEALGEMLRGFGVDRTDLPDTEAERAARYRSLLADRRVLVVLDNARDPAQVRPLLPGSSSCAVLITSRHRMTILAGTRLFPLEPLGDGDAVHLLCRAAGVATGSAEATSAGALARLCGGLPLALRVAGAQAAERDGLAGVATRLADRLDLAELALDDLSVAATFGLSLEQADDRSALLFRLLGLLDGPTFDDDVAAALLDTDRSDAAAALERLARVHLIEPGDRYRMHDLLRAYAAERVADVDAQVRADAFHRVVQWYVTMAQQAHARTERTGAALADMADAVAWGNAERDNLVPIVRQALSTPDTSAMGVSLARALQWMFVEHSYDEQWERSLELARRSAHQLGDVAAEAYLATALADCAGYHDLRRAIELYREALELGRAVADRTVVTTALINLGGTHHRLGELAEATELYEQARIEAQGFRPRAEGYVLANLAAIHRKLGRTDHAVESARGAIAVAREIGDLRLEVSALDDLADTYRAANDLDAARAAAEASVDLARTVHDTGLEAKSRTGLGAILLAQKDTAAALDALTEAASVFEANGVRQELGSTLRLLGEAHLAAGDRTAGVRCLTQALALLERLGVPEAAEVRALLG
ncbi:tetratricopeptide repeat protein [Kutzneria buriramensis]|uniref:DNA-binding SARP family transcriptional activator n=1 Tax=Kutzneria buriramensis TaxID=1045776 RepID=A0A3E0GTK7_9PSEU|nr:tetratricopeptide repeat protein [Kutzneria buriramensis]REH26191.1 DNA-binding SARP family transcriptional activator [Kutzneria buriramensis]